MFGAHLCKMGCVTWRLLVTSLTWVEVVEFWCMPFLPQLASFLVQPCPLQQWDGYRSYQLSLEVIAGWNYYLVYWLDFWSSVDVPTPDHETHASWLSVDSPGFSGHVTSAAAQNVASWGTSCWLCSTMDLEWIISVGIMMPVCLMTWHLALLSDRKFTFYFCPPWGMFGT